MRWEKVGPQRTRQRRPILGSHFVLHIRVPSFDISLELLYIQFCLGFFFFFQRTERNGADAIHAEVSITIYFVIFSPLQARTQTLI